MDIKAWVIMINPTPAPNELGSWPARTKRHRAAARTTPGPQAARTAGTGRPRVLGTRPGVPPSTGPQDSSHAGGVTEQRGRQECSPRGSAWLRVLLQPQNGGRAQGKSFGLSPPAGKAPHRFQRPRLMGSGCFPRKAHPSIPGRPRLLPASPAPGPAAGRVPAARSPARRRRSTGAGGCGASAPPTHKPAPHKHPTELQPLARGGAKTAVKISHPSPQTPVFAPTQPAKPLPPPSTNRDGVSAPRDPDAPVLWVSQFAG